MDLRVLVTRGSLENTYLAICLDHYIVGQGNSEEEACRMFGATFAAEVAYGIAHGNIQDPLKGVPKAPQKYWKMFSAAQVPGPVTADPLPLPPVSFQTDKSRCQVPVSFQLGEIEQRRAVA